MKMYKKTAQHADTRAMQIRTGNGQLKIGSCWGHKNVIRGYLKGPTQNVHRTSSSYILYIYILLAKIE